MVHFSGDWTDVDRQCVIESARQIEEAFGDGQPILGKPWVCARQSIGNRVVYLAQHFRADKVILADSPAELAVKMREQFLATD